MKRLCLYVWRFSGSDQSCKFSCRRQKIYTNTFGPASVAHVADAGVPGTRNCWFQEVWHNPQLDFQASQQVPRVDSFDL